MMIMHVIQTYFPLLLGIASCMLLLFVIGLFFIFKSIYASPLTKTSQLSTDSIQANESHTKNAIDEEVEVDAFSGEDLIATKLDLARAYLETGQEQLAKKILIMVQQRGDFSQQEEASRLLSYL